MGRPVPNDLSRILLLAGLLALGLLVGLGTIELGAGLLVLLGLVVLFFDLTFAARSIGGLFGDLAEQLIGALLFFQRLAEELFGLGEAELLGPALQRAVAGDLVMFDGLGAAHQHGIRRLGLAEVLEVLRHLFRDA